MSEQPYYRAELGNPPYQIISLDGGGIYGLTTASLLRQLCDAQQDQDSPRFLEPAEGQKYLFAGTSAGAINALLMARYENPRDFVRSGQLEAFWGEPGIYANLADPVASWLSFFGITAWLGRADFENLLMKTFGDETLGDLKHNVLLTTFDMSGQESPITGQMQWMPDIFYNFGPRNRPDVLLRDLAYAAAAPPSMRAVTRGWADGGIFSPNPSDNALAKMIQVILMRDENDLEEGGTDLLRQVLEKIEVMGDLRSITLFSVGVGYRTPYYWTSNFDFGSTLFTMLPTNPWTGHFYPPLVSLGLDAPGMIAEKRTWLMLGKHAFRLDPPILQPPFFPPTLIATAMARFDFWRLYFVDQIQRATHSSEARRYLERALDFLNSDDWRNPRRDLLAINTEVTNG
ncbi:MAG: patatin-like phospholipase family protein [Acidobacteriota bacterium]|nr:patatin-like phospholipase family protein [Acidobacteriota bacterium]